jgi:hypothetical protein
MKKTTIIFAIAFMVCLESAMAGTLGVRLNNYETSGYTATLEIQNWGAGDLTGIELSVDSGGFSTVLLKIKGDSAKEILKTIPPGIHEVTVRSQEGQEVTRTITLQKGETQLQNESAEDAKLIANKTTEEYQQNALEAGIRQDEAIQQQLLERQQMIEKLRNKDYAQEFFNPQSTTSFSTTTTNAKGKPEAGIIWLLVVVALLSLSGLVYSIIKRHKEIK